MPNEIEPNSLTIFFNKNPFSELSLHKNDQPNSLKSKISEMYINESQNHTKCDKSY